MSAKKWIVVYATGVPQEGHETASVEVFAETREQAMAFFPDRAVIKCCERTGP